MMTVEFLKQAQRETSQLIVMAESARMQSILGCCLTASLAVGGTAGFIFQPTSGWLFLCASASAALLGFAACIWFTSVSVWNGLARQRELKREIEVAIVKDVAEVRAETKEHLASFTPTPGYGERIIPPNMA